MEYKQDWRARTALLIGEAGIDILQNSYVVVLGLGGVGSAAAEALCRAGIGNLLLVDSDNVEETNLNRQLIATRDVIGKKKALALQERLYRINPEGQFLACEEFILSDNLDQLFTPRPDFIVDAIDTITAKLNIAERCFRESVPLISSMGTGGRFDPTQLRLGEISDTAGCGCSLARVMRRELKKRGVMHLPVVYSLEQPLVAVVPPDGNGHGRHSPGSTAFVPPAAGFSLASYVVRMLLKS